MRWKKRQNVGQKRAIKENDSDIGDRREKERESERECCAMKSCRITWLGGGVACANGCGFTSCVCVSVCVFVGECL